MAYVNRAYPLRFQIDNRNTDLFVRASVRDAANSVQQTLALAHIADGLYGVSWTPNTAAVYTVTYDTFTDAGFTTLADVLATGEQIEILAEPSPVLCSVCHRPARWPHGC